MHTKSDIFATPQLRHTAAHHVALVCLGNSLRGDDGASSVLVAGLPSDLQTQLCILDAESYTSEIPAFVDGHDTGIIVDAIGQTDRGNSCEPIVVDLSRQSEHFEVDIDCCHAISWLDELVLYKDVFALPSRLIFFGLPVYDTGWRCGLSTQMKAALPLASERLEGLILSEMELLCMKQR